MHKQTVYTKDAPASIGPYSQMIRVANTVYLAGQIALSPTTMHLVSDDVTAQTKQVFANIRAICQAAGGHLNDIVKLTVYVINLNDAPRINEVMQNIFTPPYPARAMVEVARLPKDAKLEIDAIMVLANDLSLD